MEFCKSCGTELQPNWKFCVKCGFDLLQNNDSELKSIRVKRLSTTEKSDNISTLYLSENDFENIRSFSLSLGTLFRQIGGYSIIQIFAAIILAIISVGIIFSAAYETSLSALFNAFQTSIWTIIIASIILEVISYFFIIKLMILLKGAVKQGIPYQDKYRKSALFFIVGIITGIILFVVAIFLINGLLQIVEEIFNDPSFEVEDLDQVPSTDIFSSLVQIGRISLSVAAFYYLKKNFRQLSGIMHNSEKVFTGFQFLIIGFLLSILGTLIGLIVDLASIIGLIGLILTIVGYFQASNGFKDTIWS